MAQKAVSTRTPKSTSTPEGGQGVVKTPLLGNEVEVTSSNTFEEVLKWDQEGKRILFACEKGQFLSLDEDQVRQLSSFTKTVYGAMKAQNRVAEAEDPDWSEVRANLKIGDTRGSARARMTVSSKDPSATADLEHRCFRPDNLANAEAKGWKVASPKRWSMPGSHDGHIGIRAHGEDELVLMERPKEFRTIAEKAKREKRAVMREAEKESYREAAAATGYRPLRDTEVADSKFKEIE